MNTNHTTTLFPADSGNISAQRLSEVRSCIAMAKSAFIQGYQKAMKETTESLATFFLNEPYQKKGFMIEGAALALTLKGAYKKNDFEDLRALLHSKSTVELILCAIGIGWGAARLNKSIDWRPAFLGQEYANAVADGYGFWHGNSKSHTAFKKIKADDILVINPNYYTGIGRSLWFKYFGNISVIVEEIRKWPEVLHKYLWRGVGTACTFTGCASFIEKQNEIDIHKLQNPFKEGMQNGNKMLLSLALQKKEVVL